MLQITISDGLIVLSVTDQKLLKLGRNYRIENELKIEIEKTKIKSLKYKKTPTSYKLFWIHHHNAGKVVTVEIKNKVDVIKKNIIFNSNICIFILSRYSCCSCFQ